jgi:hypothetical protein
MRQRVDALCAKLQRDGVNRRPFVLLAYDIIWIAPGISYRDALEVYADYVNDAPERIHADLCYWLLAAGSEVGPEQYFNALKMEVESENGISFKQGSGACAIGTDSGESAGHARSTDHRAPDQ